MTNLLQILTEGLLSHSKAFFRINSRKTCKEQWNDIPLTAKTDEDDLTPITTKASLTEQFEKLIDDPVIKVANTWANHFEVYNSVTRSAFIENYAQRCKEHRFWTISEIVDGERITLCRLGQKMLFCRDQAVIIKHIAPSSEVRSPFALELPSQLPPQITEMIPSKTPQGDQAIKLIGSLKTTFSAKLPTANVFDAMTTFSKAFGLLVGVEIQNDAPIHLTGLELNEKSRAARFIGPRRKFYNGVGAGALKAFIAQLNPEAVHAVRGVGCPCFTLYNWIVAGDARRRIQAVRAFPLLLPHVILSNAYEHFPRAFNMDIPYSAEIPIPLRLGRLVDAGAKLQTAFSEWYGCTERAVNVANAYPLHHTGSALTQIGRHGWDDQLDVLLHSCGLGSRRPTNRAEWQIWAKLIVKIPYVIKQRLSGGNQAWASFLSGCPEWSSPEWPELINKTSDLADVNVSNDGFYRAVGGWSLKRLLKLSEQWHITRDKVVIELSKADELAANEEDRPWPALLCEPIAHAATSIEIVELTVPEHLCQEAHAMHHCVDGYSDACYSGRSRIISFRKNGKSLATAEFRLKAWKDKPSAAHLVCRQLRGSRNAVIPESSPEGLAYKWLIKHILSRKISVNVEWPNVPYHSRPSRMRFREEQIRGRMREWLLSKYGIEHKGPDYQYYNDIDDQ